MNTIKMALINTVFFFHPLKKKNIVFMSYDGQYCDSPKEISNYFVEKDVQYNQIWLVNDIKKYDFDKKIRVVKYGSIKAIYYLATSKVIVDNVFGGKALELHRNKSKLKYEVRKLIFHRKRKQKVFSTWHGTPIKKMGPDQIGNDIVDWWGENIVLLLDNEYTVNVMKRCTFNKVQAVRIGAPRNDKLFSIEKNIVKELKNKAGINEEKKVVVFAPTFRSNNGNVNDNNLENSGIKQMQMIDIHGLLDALHSRFGGEWVFVCRFHYHVARMVDWEEIARKYKGLVINGNILDEMSDYLYIADALISDVSSCMYDFAITRKPCFVFFPDYYHYKEEERGFYQEIKELPFPFGETFEELLENIESFDEGDYANKIDDLEKQLGYLRNSHSTECVAEYIISHGMI